MARATVRISPRGTAHSLSHGRALALTVGTVFVFWLAYVYAHALAHHLRGARRLDWPAVTAAMAEQRAMLEASALLFVLLALGGIHLLDMHLAVRLALWAGVTQLVAWGVAYARRQRWGWPTSLSEGPSARSRVGLLTCSFAASPRSPVKAAGVHRAQQTLDGMVELRRHKPLTSCLPSMRGWFATPYGSSRSHKARAETLPRVGSLDGVRLRVA